MLLLKKQLSHPLFPCFYKINKTTTFLSSSSSSTHHLLTTLLALSTTVQSTSAQPPLITEYLVKSCGLSPEKAVKASKYLSHLQSLSKPDSVLRFFKHHGFDDAHITSLISKDPRLLTARVETTLKPKMSALQKMGFSESELIQLISENPSAIRVCNLQPKIEFWRALFGSNANLLKASRRNGYLLSYSLNERILPNISLLRECGITDRQIGTLVVRTPRFITWKMDNIKAVLKRAEKLGIPRGSGMFWYALQSMISTSETTFNTKLDLLKSFGWSEAEIITAIRKTPVILRLSEKKLRSMMNFLLKEAGFKPSYVASLPVFLTYSLERRLIPRYYVLRILKLKELPLGESELFSAIKLNEEIFLKKFILPNQKAVPELYEAYTAACAGSVPSLVPT